MILLVINAMHFYRVGRWCYERHVPVLPTLASGAIYFLFNAAIPMSVKIGEDTKLGYGGMGVVLHHASTIGKGVLIAQQVTVGGRSGHREAPVIEDNCFIGTGAKILGPVRIGAGSIIGANAVVIKDVPPRSIVAGVPARVIRSDIDMRDYT